jgi:hypothetical protein
VVWNPACRRLYSPTFDDLIKEGCVCAQKKKLISGVRGVRVIALSCSRSPPDNTDTRRRKLVSFAVSLIKIGYTIQYTLASLAAALHAS